MECIHVIQKDLKFNLEHVNKGVPHSVLRTLAAFIDSESGKYQGYPRVC